MQAWKLFVDKLQFEPPLRIEYVERVKVMVGVKFQGSDYGISIVHVQELHLVGL